MLITDFPTVVESCKNGMSIKLARERYWIQAKDDGDDAWSFL